MFQTSTCRPTGDPAAQVSQQGMVLYCTRERIAQHKCRPGLGGCTCARARGRPRPGNANFFLFSRVDTCTNFDTSMRRSIVHDEGDLMAMHDPRSIRWLALILVRYIACFTDFSMIFFAIETDRWSKADQRLDDDRKSYRL